MQKMWTQIELETEEEKITANRGDITTAVYVSYRKSLHLASDKTFHQMFVSIL